MGGVFMAYKLVASLENIHRGHEAIWLVDTTWAAVGPVDSDSTNRLSHIYVSVLSCQVDNFRPLAEFTLLIMP